jgi:adenine/guanine phosphoribosyltransferase-like PRPP-binding protein
VSGFEVVATVPSSSPERDETHPLHRIVGSIVGHTRDRYEQLLRPSGVEADARMFDPRRYVAARRLAGESVVLIDDTWTTGANIESAAAVLCEAGAGTIGAVVIGRHVHEDFGDNAARLRALPAFSWDRCASD